MIDDWFGTKIPIKVRRVSALSVLSGQTKLKTRHGLGIENELVSREGDVLDEDIEVTFNGEYTPLLFRAIENRLVDNVLETVRIKNDMLSSSNTCVKPIYTAPRGHVSAPGSQLYVFECTDLLSSSPQAQLPHNVYVAGNDKGVPILARPVSIHMHGDEYMHFEPNIVTVQEVLSLCKKRYDALTRAHMLWGIRSVKAALQPPAGRFKRVGNYLDYRLCDLLSGEAFLPIEKSGKSLVLTSDVKIRTTNSCHEFTRGTNLTDILSRWRVANDTHCRSQTNAACVLDVEDVLAGRQLLPTYRGVVTRTNLVLHWITGHTICFPVNTLSEYIVTALFRLRRANNPIKYKYNFLDGGERVKPKAVYSYEDIQGISEGEEDVVITLAPNVFPLLIRRWYKSPPNPNLASGKKAADDAEREYRAKASVWTSGRIKR